MRCDECGRFTKRLYPVPATPVGPGGIDHEACARCKGVES
jgi:hypothetical protein